MRHDSIHIHDSVFVERFIKGDSVFTTQYKERIVFRDRVSHEVHTDTVLRTDTIESVDIQIVKERPAIKEMLFNLILTLFFVAIMLAVLYFAYRKYKR